MYSANEGEGEVCGIRVFLLISNVRVLFAIFFACFCEGLPEGMGGLPSVSGSVPHLDVEDIISFDAEFFGHSGDEWVGG